MCGTRLTTSIPRCRSCTILLGLLVRRRTRRNAELAQHRRGGPEIAFVAAEAEMVVCLHRVEAGVLQHVGAQFVHQPDAAPLLRQIEQHAGTLVCHAADRAAELVAAVAAQGTEEIAGEAFRVQAGEGCLLSLRLPDQDGVLFRPPIGRPERDDAHILGVRQRYPGLADRAQGGCRQAPVAGDGIDRNRYDVSRRSSRRQQNRCRQQAGQLAQLDRRHRVRPVCRDGAGEDFAADPAGAVGSVSIAIRLRCDVVRFQGQQMDLIPLRRQTEAAQPLAGDRQEAAAWCQGEERSANRRPATSRPPSRRSRRDRSPGAPSPPRRSARAACWTARSGALGVGSAGRSIAATFVMAGPVVVRPVIRHRPLAGSRRDPHVI